MKNFVPNLIFFCVFSWGIADCLSAQSTVTIYGLRGSSGVAMLELFERPPQHPGVNIRVEALAQADLMAVRFIRGEAQIGILPPNVAARIAADGRRIQVAAVIGNGMLSLLTSDNNVRRIEDLRGRTIEVAGQGATPDYVFRRILLSRHLNPDRDVRLSYSLAPPEIAQSLIAGRVSTALLPEPFATMARLGRPSLRDVSDIQSDWITAGGIENYPMTVVVVNADFAAANPALLRTILNAFERSVNMVRANPQSAGALAERHDLGLRANIVSASIPRSNYVFIPASAARPALEALFGTFLEFSPVSIGGRLPDDSFYLSW